MSIVFSHMATVKDASQQAVFQRYFKALALMAKNYIFLQLEGIAIVEFHMVLKDALTAYGDWDGKNETLESTIDGVFGALYAGTDFIASLKDLMAVGLMTSREKTKRGL